MGLKITFEHLEFNFKQKPFEPLSEANYTAIRKNGDGFIESYIVHAKTKFDAAPNPLKLYRNLLLGALGVMLLAIGISSIVTSLGNERMGRIILGIGVPFVIPIIIIALKWYHAWVSSSRFGTFRRAATAHFRFHQKYAVKSGTYELYLSNLLKANIDEYKEFMFAERNS